MKRLLVFLAAAAVMAACADSSTAPVTPTKGMTPRALHDDLVCRSGYPVAYDENGNPYCAPETFTTTQSPSAPLIGR